MFSVALFIFTYQLPSSFSMASPSPQTIAILMQVRRVGRINFSFFPPRFYFLFKFFKFMPVRLKTYNKIVLKVLVRDGIGHV